MNIVRPAIADLSLFCLRGPLHPELFHPTESRSLSLEDCNLDFHLTPDGHVIRWHQGCYAVTEAIVKRDWPAPKKGRLAWGRIRHPLRKQVTPFPFLKWETETRVEQAGDFLLEYLQNELIDESKKRGLFHRFPTSNRILPAPIGLITAEGIRGRIVIHTFHTYPVEGSILRTQTLIEFE